MTPYHRAIEKYRDKRVINENLPQKNQGTLMEVNLQPRPSFETEKNPIKDHGMWDTFLLKDQHIICIMKIDHRVCIIS